MSPPSEADLTLYVDDIASSGVITELGARGNVGEMCTGYIDIISVINTQRRNSQTGQKDKTQSQKDPWSEKIKDPITSPPKFEN